MERVYNRTSVKYEQRLRKKIRRLKKTHEEEKNII
jgi:hypothetical protein